MRLLDTNIVNHLRNGNPIVLRHLAPVAGNVAISALIAEEILVHGHGAEINRIRGSKSHDRLEKTYADFADSIRTLSAFHIYPYTAEAEAIFRTFRSARLKGMDGRIAAHALSLGFILVTENMRDFVAVPGLTVEDWTRAETTMDSNR